MDGPDALVRNHVSLLDCMNQKQDTVSTGPTWFRNKDKKTNFWFPTQYLSFASLINYSGTFLPGDSLTLICEITLSSITDVVEFDTANSCSKQSWISMKKDLLAATKQTCLQQLKNSYQNGDFADMELMCDTKVFKCHQFILSTRSPVFRAMFQNPMAEATTKTVEIKDLSPEIVDAMLLFIYTGDVPNLDELAVELLAAAEKYALEDLKSLCEQQLTSGLDIENAVDLFLLADMYLAASLRKNAVQLLARNLNEVLTNAVWKQKMEGQTILLSEIMLESLAMNNKEIKGKN